MTERLTHFLIGFPVTFVLIFGVLTLGDIAHERLELWKIEQTPRTEYFDYQDISYVKTTRDGLVMASTSIVKQSYPTAWNDILRCGNKEFRFYSVQNTNSDSPTPRTDYRRIEWDYLSGVPIKDTPCQMTSTITMSVKGISKVQTVLSDKFRIGQ